MKMPNLKTLAITVAATVFITGYLLKAARSAEKAKPGSGADTIAGKLGLI